MYIRMAALRVKPEHHDRWKEILEDDALHSLKDEPGVTNFYVLQDENDENIIHVVEMYKQRSDFFEGHKNAPHYLRMQAGVKDFPVEIVARWECSNVYPSDAEWR